jgi:hypothetical protein
MSRYPDAAMQLERALVAMADAAGCPIVPAAATSTPWASATFAGARHLLEIEATHSVLLRAWLVAVTEAEFALRGNLVVDIKVTGFRRARDLATFTLEALTVEER